MDYSDQLLGELEDERAQAAKGVGVSDLGGALARILWPLSPLLPALASAVHKSDDPEELIFLRDNAVEFAGAVLEFALAMDPRLREQDISDAAGIRSLLDQLPDLSENWITEPTLPECLIEWGTSMQKDLVTLGTGLQRAPGERGHTVRNALAVVRDALDLVVYLDSKL